MTSSAASKLVVGSDSVGQIIVLTPDGVLDATTYLSLRDNIIKAALDDPRAVVVDVSGLPVPRESALAVFTSARWHVERWPEVPICWPATAIQGATPSPVTGSPAMALSIRASNLLVMHWLRGTGPGRQRVRVDLPAQVTSLRRSREFVDEWLPAWSMPNWIPVTKIIVTTFVENVLEHTAGDPESVLETDGATVTVAVEDTSHSQANLRESPNATVIRRAADPQCAVPDVGKLADAAGKTVWAVIGPGNRL